MSAVTITDKSFATAAAKAALAGYGLWRSDATDGVVRYFLCRWSMVRVCADLAEVDMLLERAGAA